VTTAKLIYNSKHNILFLVWRQLFASQYKFSDLRQWSVESD